MTNEGDDNSEVSIYYFITLFKTKLYLITWCYAMYEVQVIL